MTSYDDLITARDNIREQIKDHSDCANPEHLMALLETLQKIDDRLANVGAESDDGDPFFQVVSYQR